MNTPNCESLILLVGSNPLPNYLAACAIKPKTVFPIYSEQSEPLKNSLGRVLAAQSMKVDFGIQVPDSTSPRLVYDALQRLTITDSTYLDYTGGTKVMAAQARLVFADKGGVPAHASYLSDDGRELRFDRVEDGLSLDDMPIALSLACILQLHGFSRDPNRNPKRLPPAEQAKPRILRLLNDLTSHEQEDDQALEAWVRRCVRAVDDGCEIDGNLYVRTPGGGRSFEVDVVVVRKHRIYYISCTTKGKTSKDSTLHDCKEKLFEAMARARQIGGDLARVALVSLLHGKTTSDKKEIQRVEVVQSDVETLWESAIRPKVFGLEDVKAWAGVEGPPRLNTLERWLTS